ncbi:MAG: preprotein translocase subunit SecE, partial [Thermoleophilum sp.]|nr:preprotein translocase subunit SecE [Thermoleophilum sp.]
ETRHRVVALGPVHLRVACCVGCSFLFTLPRPHKDDLRKVFLDYDPPEEERVRAHIGARQPVYAEGLARIARYKREGRLLDVGSSFGAFLRAAKEAGWEAVGIEPSRPAAESASAARETAAAGGSGHQVSGAAAPRATGGVARVVQFLREVRAELARVEWPNREALVRLTGVVIAFVIVAGAYLGLLDAAFSRLVRLIL